MTQRDFAAAQLKDAIERSCSVVQSRNHHERDIPLAPDGRLLEESLLDAIGQARRMAEANHVLHHALDAAMRSEE